MKMPSEVDMGYEDISGEIERSTQHPQERRFKRRNGNEGFVSEFAVQSRLEALGKRERDEKEANDLAALLETTILEDERPKKKVRTEEINNLGSMVERLGLSEGSYRNTEESSKAESSSASMSR